MTLAALVAGCATERLPDLPPKVPVKDKTTDGENTEQDNGLPSKDPSRKW